MGDFGYEQSGQNLLSRLGQVTVKQLTVTNWENLWPNGTSESPPPPHVRPRDNGLMPEFDYRQQVDDAYAGGFVRRLPYRATGQGTKFSRVVSCLPEEFFRLEARGRVSLDSLAAVVSIEFLDREENVLGAAATASTDSGSWALLQVNAVAPAGAVYCRFSLEVASGLLGKAAGPLGVGAEADLPLLPAAMPVASPPGGSFPQGSSLEVTLAAAAGALIYYTLDGSTPTTGSTPYAGPISIAASATLKAIAVAPGFEPSPVMSEEYVIEAALAAPVISPASGSYEGDLTVSITAEEGASIYYTLDGSTPTPASTLYTGPFVIPAAPPAPNYEQGLTDDGGQTISPWPPGTLGQDVAGYRASDPCRFLEVVPGPLLHAGQFFSISGPGFRAATRVYYKKLTGDFGDPVGTTFEQTLAAPGDYQTSSQDLVLFGPGVMYQWGDLLEVHLVVGGADTVVGLAVLEQLNW
jgi:hypothetical protein